MGLLQKVFFLVLCSKLVASKPCKPHIVFVVADDLGWNDVSFHGSKQIPTPNIDALAKDGIILNSYYVTPICSPSRGSLMTGKYPTRLGLQHGVINANSPWGLPMEEKILPQYLKELSYVTRGVGKWHLGFYEEAYLPMKRGFDSFFGYWTGLEDYYTHFSNEDNTTGLDLHDDFKNAWGYEGVYGTELFTMKAKEVIRNHNPEEPLFLYFSQQAPHSGNFDNALQVPETYVKPLGCIDDKNRTKFAGMVSALDHSLGELFEALSKSGIFDNMIFVFTTDNGAAVEGLDGTSGSNYPLRGSKYNFWEGGIRGVSFIWSPLLRNRTRIYNGLMHISDWLPTLLSAVGGAKVENILKEIDGVNQWPSLIRDLPSPRREMLLNIDSVQNMEGIRVDNYKYLKGDYEGGKFDGWYDKNGKLIEDIPHHESKFCQQWYERTYLKFLKQSKVARILRQKYGKDPRHVLSCATPEYKKQLEVNCGSLRPIVSSCKPREKPCLFDIKRDPCEYHNIAEEMPEVVERLKLAINEHRSQVRQPGERPPDPLADPKLHGDAWVPWRE